MDKYQLHKTFRVISMILFLIVLLLVYGYLPENVLLYSNEGVAYQYTISKPIFFYISLASFLVTNLVLVFSNKILEQFNRIGQRTKTLQQDRSDRMSKLRNWMASFSAVLNFNYVLIISFLCLYNFGEGRFGWILYVGIVPIIIWIFKLFQIFNTRKTIA